MYGFILRCKDARMQGFEEMDLKKIYGLRITACPYLKLFISIT